MEIIKKYNSEAETWNEFRNGSEKAFEWIYDKYFSQLFNYGLQIFSNRDLVKDSIQDLFIDLWRKKENLSEIYSIKSYLYKSLRRKIIKEISRETKYHCTEVKENYAFEATPSYEFILVAGQAAHDLHKRLSKSFLMLTKRQKEAVFLKFYDNLSYEDIAVVMALKNVKYARTLIYRAIDVLKLSITKEMLY